MLDKPCVLVTGPSAAGKTRAAITALRRAFPGARLLTPHSPAALSRIFELNPRVGEQTVLWLDDLEIFLSAGALTPPMLIDLEKRAGELTLLATMRSSYVHELLKGNSDLFRLPGARVMANWLSEPGSPLAEVQLTTQLSNDETEVAARAGYPSQELRGAMGEWFLAGQALLRKLDAGVDATGRPCPEGVAVARATLDWGRAGGFGGIDKTRLRALAYECYRTGSGPKASRRQFERSLFERGLHWATEPLVESVALVDPTSVQARQRGSSTCYVGLDFVASALDKRDRPPDRIHPAVWGAFADDPEVSPWELRVLGFRAYESDQLDIAERAWERALAADDKGDPGLCYCLGVIANNTGRSDRAIELYRVAAADDYPSADLNLGLSLARRSSADVPEAIEILESVSPDSDYGYKAWIALGCLHYLDDCERARDWFARAGKQTDEEFGIYLRMFATSVEVDRGEPFLREAMELGAPGAAWLLGEIAEARSDPEEARMLYRAELSLGIRHFSDLAAVSLATLLADDFPEEAEALLVGALDSTHVETAARASLRLGQLHMLRGNLEQGEKLLRENIPKASAETARIPSLMLAILLSEKRPDEARDLVNKALVGADEKTREMADRVRGSISLGSRSSP